jgi:hypothetical protein
VTWSDGSISLLVGKEVYDVAANDYPDYRDIYVRQRYEPMRLCEATCQIGRVSCCVVYFSFLRFVYDFVLRVCTRFVIRIYLLSDYLALI